MAETVIRYSADGSSLENVPAIQEITIEASATSIKGGEATSAFKNARNSIQRVYFKPKSQMQSISTFCFFNCIQLTTVDFSNCLNIRSINDNAFYFCTSLTQIELPSGVTTIGNSVFANSGLTSINIPSSVQNFGYYNFYECKQLTEFTIDPATPMTFLNNHQFTSTKLVSLHLTKFIKDFSGDNFESVTTIVSLTVDSENPHLVAEENVVFNRQKTTLLYAASTKTGHYKIPEGITDIPNCAFTGSQITSIEFPDSLIKIGGWCFVGSALQTLTFPPNLTSIGESAFSGCSQLSNIVFSDKIETIGTTCFSGCDKLTEVTLPKGIKNLGGSAFPSKVTLSFPPESGLEIYDNIFIVDTLKTKLVQCLSSKSVLNLPSSIEVIVSSSFSSIRTLNKLVVPDDSKLKSIKGGAFQYSSIAEISLPESLEEIESRAFYECNSLVEIHFGGKLRNVYDNAFYSCNALRTLTVSDNGELISLGRSVFQGCEILNTVDFKGRLQKIGDSCFDSCKKLLEISFSSDITTIVDKAFQFSGLTKVIFPPTSSLTSFSVRCFYKCTELSSLNIPEGVAIISDEAFAYTKLTDVILPISVKQLNDYCFQYCTELQTLTIPANSALAKVGFGVFYNCVSFRLINNQCENFEIENDALFTKGKTELIVLPPKSPCKYFSFPVSLNVVGICALQGCHNIHVIFVPSSVTKIMEYAFNDCINLRSINIPINCTFVGENAFMGCKKMQCGISIENQNTEFHKNLTTLSGLPKRAIDDCVDGCVTINKYRNGQHLTLFFTYCLLMTF